MFEVGNDLADQIRHHTKGLFSDDEIFIRETRGENGDVRREIITHSGRTMAEVAPDEKGLRKAGYSPNRFPGDSVKKDKTAGPGEIEVESLGDNIRRQKALKERDLILGRLSDSKAAPDADIKSDKRRPFPAQNRL